MSHAPDLGLSENDHIISLNSSAKTLIPQTCSNWHPECMDQWTLRYLDAVMAQTGWSMNQVSELTGIAASTVNRPYREGGNLSRRTLDKIHEKSGLDPKPYAPESVRARWYGLEDEGADFKPRPDPSPTLTIMSGRSNIKVSIDSGIAEIAATVDADGIAKLREKLDLIEALLRN